MRPLDPTRVRAPARLHAVKTSGLDGAGPRTELDALIEAVAFAFDAKIAVLSIVGADRVWFLARKGLDACEAPPELSFCTRVVERAAPFVVLNASTDPDLADHPFVTGPPFVRFYAGTPFHAENGEMLGSLAVIDDQPRFRFTDADRAAMANFSTLATHLAGARERRSAAA